MTILNETQVKKPNDCDAISSPNIISLENIPRSNERNKKNKTKNRIQMNVLEFRTLKTSYRR